MDGISLNYTYIEELLNIKNNWERKFISTRIISSKINVLKDYFLYKFRHLKTYYGDQPKSGIYMKTSVEPT